MSRHVPHADATVITLDDGHAVRGKPVRSTGASRGDEECSCAYHRPRSPEIVALQRHDELVVVVFDGELWVWNARRADTWTFVSLPTEASEEIRDLAGGVRRGFGSLRVWVTVGGSTWKTSIFPDSSRGSYVVPIKRAVRTAEALDAGDIATVIVELIDF
jgi:hypothetical protein